MENTIIEIINQFGYIGITFLIALENIFPPIPSELILTFGGFLTTTTNLTILKVIIASTIGAIIGAIALYLIGRIISTERIEKWLDGKVGKVLRLKKSDIEKARKWFDKHGNITVFVCRCIPIVRSLISIPAGMTKMRFDLFLIFTCLGTLIWNTVLVVLGAKLGSAWSIITEYTSTYTKITFITLVALFITGVYIFYKKKS